MTHLLELFTTREYLLSGWLVADEDGQRDIVVVEIDFQGFQDALENVLHLLFYQLIIDSYLYLWQFRDDRIHIFHAGGNAAVLLGHAVAHREPLQFEVFLGKRLVFCGLLVFAVADAAWDDVHLRGFTAEIAP